MQILAFPASSRHIPPFPAFLSYLVCLHQLDLFTDYAAEEEKQKAEDAALERERKIQAATLAIKKKYGKNAILKAMNLEEGATAKNRNAQIGGHKA